MQLICAAPGFDDSADTRIGTGSMRRCTATTDVDPGLNRDEARTISTDDRYLAKKGQRHIAPDVMRPHID